MAFVPGVLQGAIYQESTDTTAAERWLDGERPEQERRRHSDQHRQLPDRSDQQRADTRGEGEFEQMADVLADAVGAEHEAARAEGALVQPLDRLGIAGRFGKDGEREFGHVSMRLPANGPGSRQENASM